MSNGSGISDRLAELAKREAEIRRKIAAEQERLRKREKQNAEKEEALIGAAAVKAAAASPEFKLMIAQTALAYISDEKHRRFLADRGWKF